MLKVKVKCYCPVQVAKVNVGMEVQLHVFLALDLQESG